VVQELSPGAGKPFVINSHVVSVTTDYARTLTTTVSASYSCDTDAARLTWLGRTGWKAKPDSVLLYSKPAHIC
jgi:hypothetical protein